MPAGSPIASATSGPEDSGAFNVVSASAYGVLTLLTRSWFCQFTELPTAAAESTS